MLKTGALQSAILHSAHFSIIATDERGIIQLFNAGAERMLGYQSDEVVNRLRPDDMHDPVEVTTRALSLSLEFGTAIEPGFEALAFKASRDVEDVYELTYVRKDGSRFPALISITALRNENAGLIGYLLIGSDNSARKKAETALTAATVLAEKANLAKSEFLSSMSHELRTPLNAILGFAQLLQSGAPSPTDSQRRNLDQILKAGWYLLELINEVLDLALVESGKVTLSQEPVSLFEVIGECRAMIEPQAKQREISMRFPRFDAPLYVSADRTRIKQVLINLLFNAIKYNRLKGSIGVDCRLVSPDTVRIEIEDTGDGLTSAQTAQLFQPFNRLGKESGDEQGTGIGLVVTKRLVELMGGRIGVESKPGTGSVFWFEMKLTQAPRLAHSATVDAEPMPAESSEDMPVRTILYVEDNPANLALVELLIARRRDLRVISAADGKVGIEYARAYQPDIILMDINLPGISGIDAMRLLRTEPLTAHIPILALSANAVPRDIQHALDAGFLDYLTKPIVLDQFMAAIDAALESARGSHIRSATEE